MRDRARGERHRLVHDDRAGAGVDHDLGGGRRRAHVEVLNLGEERDARVGRAGHAHPDRAAVEGVGGAGAHALVDRVDDLARGRVVAAVEVELDRVALGERRRDGALVNMAPGAKLADVVKALNSLGATPQDLLAILQAMKSAGALVAELEVI